MDEIARELRNAVAEPPPSRIDVAGLIHAEEQRHRQRTWLWGGTGVAAAVAAAVLTPALLSGVAAPTPAPGSPTAGVRGCAVVTPGPLGPQPPAQSHAAVRTLPTEPPADTVVRLTGVIRDVLRTDLPAGVRAEATPPGCEPQFTYRYQAPFREYELRATLRRGQEWGSFMLRVRPTNRDMATPACYQVPGAKDCRLLRHPDGSTSMVGRFSSTPGQDELWTVLVLRDGTSVLAHTDNFRNQRGDKGLESRATAPEPLLTIDQLVALTRTPGLTLYP